jgi:SAM-dependent methyltransferase
LHVAPKLEAVSLVEWFASPLGQRLLAHEQAFCDKTVADIFGYYALQIGLAPLPLLRQSRIANLIRLDWAHVADCQAAPDALPFTENSLDLVLMPHCVEYHPEPEAILREAFRVLRPEGRLLITGFNPFSLLGAQRYFGKTAGAPWDSHFVSLHRMKDWLNVLGFELCGGQLAGYHLPTQSEAWLARTQFLESMGDRWWPIAGGLYCLHAVKRVKGVRLLHKPWTAQFRDRRLATAPAATSAQNKPD